LPPLNADDVSHHERIERQVAYLIQALPDPANVKRAIQELDFIVSVDVLPAEICGWSDVVLPEATYLERYDDLWSPPHKEPFVCFRQPAVEPMYDSRPGWWIAREIGLRSPWNSTFPGRPLMSTCGIGSPLPGLIGKVCRRAALRQRSRVLFARKRASP
jgi:hypothetical protein